MADHGVMVIRYARKGEADLASSASAEFSEALLNKIKESGVASLQGLLGSDRESELRGRAERYWARVFSDDPPAKDQGRPPETSR